MSDPHDQLLAEFASYIGAHPMVDSETAAEMADVMAAGAEQYAIARTVEFLRDFERDADEQGHRQRALAIAWMRRQLDEVDFVSEGA